MKELGLHQENQYPFSLSLSNSAWAHHGATTIQVPEASNDNQDFFSVWPLKEQDHSGRSTITHEPQNRP